LSNIEDVQSSNERCDVRGSLQDFHHNVSGSSSPYGWRHPLCLWLIMTDFPTFNGATPVNLHEPDAKQIIR